MQMGRELESGCFTIASLSVFVIPCQWPVAVAVAHPFAGGNFKIGPLCLTLMKVVAAADERGVQKDPKRG